MPVGPSPGQRESRYARELPISRTMIPVADDLRDPRRSPLGCERTPSTPASSPSPPSSPVFFSSAGSISSPPSRTGCTSPWWSSVERCGSWPPPCGGTPAPWHPKAFIGANMAAIAVVAYTTGWGPILSIGFLFGAAAALELFGSRATTPCLVWTAIAMTVGQLAIALHLAPTMIHEPLVHGVAGLGLLGALLVIQLLGRADAEREAVEDELRRSERRFSAMVTSSSDIVIVVGTDGEFEYASPAFETVLGYPSAEVHSLMGRPCCTPTTGPRWAPPWPPRGPRPVPSSTRSSDCGVPTGTGCGSRRPSPI